MLLLVGILIRIEDFFVEVIGIVFIHIIKASPHLVLFFLVVFLFFEFSVVVFPVFLTPVVSFILIIMYFKLVVVLFVILVKVTFK